MKPVLPVAPTIPVMRIVASAPPAPLPPVAADTEPRVLKKRELIGRIVDQTGVKKKDAKAVMEAMLTILGEALSNGEELNLPPFGKAKINRQRKDAQGDMIVMKLKRGGPGQNGSGGNQSLADTDEDD